MSYRLRWIARGMGYVLRGFRDGRMSLVVLGCFTIVRFLATRRDRGMVTQFRLDPGSRVELRVK